MINVSYDFVSVQLSLISLMRLLHGRRETEYVFTGYMDTLPLLLIQNQLN